MYTKTFNLIEFGEEILTMERVSEMIVRMKKKGEENEV